MLSLILDKPTGTSLIRGRVRDFAKQKDLFGFLMDFSREQKEFGQKYTRVLGVNVLRDKPCQGHSYSELF